MTNPIPDQLPDPQPIVEQPNPIAAQEARPLRTSPPDAAPNPAETFYVDYGVTLPNGNVHWTIYNQRLVNTPSARADFVQALRNTADELGFNQDEFLSRFRWHTRHVHLTDLGSLPITADSAVTERIDA
jgi:hypothetical protein